MVARPGSRTKCQVPKVAMTVQALRMRIITLWVEPIISMPWRANDASKTRHTVTEY